MVVAINILYFIIDNNSTIIATNPRKQAFAFQ